ncbi:Putative cyclin-D6-1 [Linum perenne]
MEFDFDLENPLTSSNDTIEPTNTIRLLFSSEPDHMPSSYPVSFRREAISIVSSSDSSSDPFVPYLAVNYIDRFVSKLPALEDKPWVVQLVAVSCLSLAAKMRNFEFSVANFQDGVCFEFDEKTVNKMEMMILDGLHWRMRSITPFSFLHFFSSMVEPVGLVRDRAKEVIFKAQHVSIFFGQSEIKMLEFRPSVVAASAALVACQELLPLQFLSLHSSILSSGFVNMENLEVCLNYMQEMAVGSDGFMTDTMSSMSVRRTPLSVLSWNSVGSETTATVVVDSPMKRRKINGYDMC